MSKNLRSIMTNTDSYKSSMSKQYPLGTEYVYSYIEARGGTYNETLFYGIQKFVKEYLLTPITQEQIDYAEKFWTIHGEPFPKEMWQHILDVHNGYLPLEIKSVKEGTVLPTKNVLVTVENTDPKCFALTTWLETALLRAVWYPTTVATTSWRIKQVIKSYLEKSGDVGGLAFKLHDFGARGVSSKESAGLGASAHLINFMGTDTVEGIFVHNDYYNAPLETIGFSIPAAEHSTITSWNKSLEQVAYENMITQFSKPGSIYAVVSDSYDIYNACKIWVSLKDKIIAGGGTLVIRPDSGDPTYVIPEMLRILSEGFGYTKNDKGYKVLNNVRIIWGDGINELSIKSILRTVVDMLGWSADNLAFGMGGALLGKAQRDDIGWAMKCSSAKINGVWVDVFKDPITDKGKVSKKGRVTLFKNTKGEYYSGKEDWMNSELQVVFKDGKLYNETSLEEIRARSNEG